uniref:Uncharacterized protein n=1 Tax=Nelumbo nucifera TaxID=4432 RepID=A0A822Y7D6_NELNU|nr:TPA_asm: hypothetical protein HUJ06_029432 [Nelumbo nucifera]
MEKTRKMNSETLTLVLVNLAGIMEREVGAALNTDPTGLGSLTLFRSIPPPVMVVCRRR